MKYFSSVVLIFLLSASLIYGMQKKAEVDTLKQTVSDLNQKYERQQDITRSLLNSMRTNSPEQPKEEILYSTPSEAVLTFPESEPLLNGEVTGFYYEYAEDGWDEREYGELKPCNGFKVITGDQEIINKHTQGSEQMVINLLLNELNSSDQTKIKAATKESPITITIKERPLTYTDAGPCHPFFLVSIK